MNSNNNGCHQSGCGCQQCSNGKFNCNGVRPFRAIDAAFIPPSIPEPPKEAYGSFYNLDEDSVTVNPVEPPDSGQKVIFTNPGPSLNVDPAPIPNNTTDLQVSTSGVYEISMDISVFLTHSTSDAVGPNVLFGLFINDTMMVTESKFQSVISILTIPTVPAIISTVNTIGKTIQLRLNKDDRISIRVILARGTATYRFPSLVVNKIAD